MHERNAPSSGGEPTGPTMGGASGRVSRVFLISFAASMLLGLAGGTGFLWVANRRAWEILTGAFLWVLILSAGTTIGRFFAERVRRGNWRRGFWLAGAQTFPLTTAFLLTATLVAGFAIVPTAAPVFYIGTLAVALCTGMLGVFTSPFIK